MALMKFLQMLPVPAKALDFKFQVHWEQFEFANRLLWTLSGAAAVEKS